MADFPIEDGARYDVVGKTNTGTRGKLITASTNINTKGAYVALSTSTPFDASAFLITLFQADASGSAFFLVDLAVGTSGSEVDILSNLLIASGAATGRGAAWEAYFPLSVPSGTQLSARCQSNVTSSITASTVNILAYPISRGLMPGAPLGRATNYGAILSSSRGTTITAGATVDTKGAWTTLSTSTTNPIRYAVALIHNSVPAVSKTMFDIGVGTSGSEVVVVPDLAVGDISGRGHTLTAHSVFLNIPSGTQLSMRSQSNVASKVMDVVIVGCD